MQLNLKLNFLFYQGEEKGRPEGLMKFVRIVATCKKICLGTLLLMSVMNFQKINYLLTSVCFSEEILFLTD